MLRNCNSLFNFSGIDKVDCNRQEINDVIDTVNDMSGNIP